MCRRNNTYFDNDYRFGFNGQEKDNEVAGIGNSNTAQFWQYDTRLGRRWNLDPKPSASISSYAAFSNNPILFTDVLGDTVLNRNAKSNTLLILPYGFESDPALYNHYESGLEAGFNMIVVKDVKDVVNDIKENALKYDHVILSGHGSAQESTVRIGLYGYRSKDLDKAKADLAFIGQYINTSEGNNGTSIILLQCWGAAPKCSDASQNVNSNSDPLLLKLSKYTGDNILGNSSLTPSTNTMFQGDGKPLSINQYKTAKNKKFADETKGKWRLFTPTGKIRNIGNIRINNNGDAIKTKKQGNSRAKTPK